MVLSRLLIQSSILTSQMPEISKTVNPDLTKERKNASFDVEEFAVWFYGGQGMLQMKRLVEEEIYKDLEDTVDYEYVSYEELYNFAVKQAVKSTTKLKELQERIHPGGREIYPTLTGGPIGGALMPSGNPMAVHTIMFISALRGQGTPEQFEKFGKRGERCEIIGTYAQTELGHGTYLRGLETRADFDRTTDEFILNTPTITSYKWWPGGLGQTVNYCIVVAQLYIDNEPKGVHMFLLQVRDEETHMPLPGIDIGDIGKKIGMVSSNNGFLGLKDVRVPRENMLMKNSQVERDGTYVKSPVATLTYLPMVFVRCMVALGNALLLTQAATITTRYSAVRRQSPINPEEPEPQILDHLTQQLKVFPEIAASIAYRLAGGRLLDLYEVIANAINNKDYSRLPELHALACTLKASCSYDTTFGIERLRLSCGGHGYLTAANLGNIFTTATAACTYEGENSVLYLQVGRILMKAWADLLDGRPLMPTMSYLAECAALKTFPKWSGDWQCLVKAVQYAAADKTRHAYANYSRRLREGQIPPVAANNTGLELTQAAELHGRAFVVHTFWEEVTGSKATSRSPQLNKVLENILELYLIQSAMRHMGDILRCVPVTDDDLCALQKRLEIVLSKIRPDAVAICDGFDHHDRVLNSILGCYDGNVYERIFKSAKENPLNRTPVQILIMNI